MDKKPFKMDNLRTLREKKKLTQIRLSTELGISQELLSQYEIGSSLPNILNLIKIADYFNCSIDYLTGRTNNITPIKDLNKQEIKFKTLYDKYNLLNAKQKEQLENFLDYLCTNPK